ncbi:MFS transporter [Agromyces sp. NPDC058136]|uniref:MFS transporter n=1 Tax=Agromyces sp. NPDC058136 TaxID=3346354 RepID=UPI0036DC5B3F
MSDHAADTLVQPDQAGTKLPPSLRRLFRVAPLAAAAAPLAYGVTAFFMAIQVQLFDAETKVENLALINTLSAVAAMLAQPIFGVLSDRTRTRWGARHPWMLVGAAIGTVALVSAGFATNVAMLTVCVMLVQFGYNAWQGPFSALLPDRVPERFRGRYSTGVGLGVLLGAVLGPILASPFAESIPVGYASLAGVAILLILLFIALVPGADNRSESRKPFSITAFLSAFWVNPIRYPDFFWGFTGRFLLFGGYTMISAYSLYIAQDYVGLSLAEATSIVPLLGLAGLPGLIIATAVAGPLSDRLGRRKPLVLISGLIIAAGAVIPFLMPSVLGLALQTIVVTIGFGAFAAVDQALMASVLPDPEDFGKDLGVLNLAATLPTTVAPVAAGAVVLAVGYAPLFLLVGGIAVLGALAVLPIRSVR